MTTCAVLSSMLTTRRCRPWRSGSKTTLTPATASAAKSQSSMQTGIVAAAFRQHTSRALDPQLHTHLVIANRVKSPDGRWLALDARLIKHDQQTLSALYHVALRSELTASLGVRWNAPEHGIAEIADMPEALLVEFSTRTGAVARRIEEKLDRFITTMERDPTPRERWKLEREAAIDSRPAKVKGVDAASLHQAWAEQAAALGFDPPTVVANTIGHVVGQDDINPHQTAQIARAAMKTMAEKQSTWRPTELQRELAAQVPTDTTLPARDLVAMARRCRRRTSCATIASTSPSLCQPAR